jgi:hypothetical protein
MWRLMWRMNLRLCLGFLYMPLDSTTTKQARCSLQQGGALLHRHIEQSQTS